MELQKQNRKKVFVINDRGYDYTPAEKYGEVHIISKGSVNIFDPRWYHALKVVLKRMQQKKISFL